VLFIVAREAAGASSIRHSLRPLLLERRTVDAKLGRFASRERGVLPRHCERSEAIQNLSAVIFWIASSLRSSQ
jgi:hypothetical protein